VSDPRAEILSRLEARRARTAALDRRDRRVALARLALFAAVVAIAAASLGAHVLSPVWLLAPAAAFVALIVHHDRILRARERSRRAVRFHEAALARVEERWQGTGNRGERWREEGHPYAADLDLFGEGSLFELLCAARTLGGEETLARWLLAPAAPAEIAARQRAIAVLAPRLDLREDLAVLGEDVRAEIDPSSLAAWAEGPPVLPRGAVRAAAALASLAAVGTLGGWLAGRLHLLAFVAAATAVWAVSRSLRDRVERVLGGALRPGRELDVLALLLARLEREPDGADPRLAALLEAFTEGDRRASRAIAALARRASAAEWAKNQLFAPLAFLLGWRLQCAFAVEGWRLAHGARVRAWLAALGEVEALSSLAGYSREHPADPFADVGDGPPRLSGEGLAHPLLPAARSVANDVVLGLRDGGSVAPGQPPPAGPALASSRLLVVSGSNMSGKSTLLRTVGVNVVLALAGAPVRARRLSMTPVAVGATLRIQDSLQGGRSRFYAEIERLKQLADLARGAPPLLFLLDELLHGTNSHDRLVGAEAVLRELLARGAVGLATTHDLALTAAAARIPEAANAHFEDRVEDGRIAFDYRLRPGVVERSNALALMRAVGLEV